MGQHVFRPTSAPPGRLVRLGVVLDTRNPAARLGLIAQLCERAGIDALWTQDLFGDAAQLSAVAALSIAAGATQRTSLGLVVHAPDDELRSLLQATPELDLTRLEVTLPARLWATQVSWSRLSLAVADAAKAEAAVRLADDVLVTATQPAEVTRLAEVVRHACARAGRDPASLGIALQVPVSIGRTRAEAWARADAEPLFRTLGHPAERGIFGTLEECQDRVIALAHAGVTDLRCVLPNSPDVPDVIAQLTAMVVGSREVLVPGAPRSRPPDPPIGWGGRRQR